VALLYLGLFVVLPVVAVLESGFGDGLTNLKDAMASFGAWKAIRLTVVMAVLTAVINGAFGTLLAYVLVRIRFPGRELLSAIVDLPFAIPSLVAGVIFAPPGILLALLFVTLPLVVRSVQPVLAELDRDEEEAAHTLGSGRWTTFRKIVLPALRPAIAAGSLLAFSRSLGEFGAIVFVAGNIPNKTLTAPVFITQLINVSPDQAAAVSALIFGLAFMVVLVTEKLISRHSDRYSA
jgi:sulfate transport system permease protein